MRRSWRGRASTMPEARAIAALQHWTRHGAAGRLQALPEPRMSDPRLAELSRLLPELRLLTAPGELEHYGRDWTRRWTPAPLAIALPASAEEVQAIVRWANDRHLAIVPSGGRTGLSGGAVAAHGE